MKNQIVLPPKRWETAESPIFDPIRGKPWFQKLLKRKHHIPALEQAYRECMANLNETQKSIAKIWDVDERELRDYIKFKHDQNPEITDQAQRVIDMAYKLYCESKAIRSFSWCVELAANAAGLRTRPYRELWEVCPNYYPSSYVKQA